VIAGFRWLARAGLATALLALLLVALPRFSGVDAMAGASGLEDISNRGDLPFKLAGLRGIFPFGLLVSTMEFHLAARNRQEIQARLDAFRFHAHAVAPSGGREIYVLVIGESSRANRWSLDGYARETNPRLSREPNLVVLRDVISPWTFTTAAVPIITTRKEGTDRSRLIREKSIISLFREAGFRTYWLSSQAQPTSAVSPIGQISAEADERVWANVSTNNVFGLSRHDGVLLPVLRGVIDRNEKRQFIVLHIMGSHDSYHRRYPDSFNRFQPSMTDEAGGGLGPDDGHVRLRNSYDNSILYTDTIIADVIQALRASAAVSALFYTSDHGESLFDGACQLSGHGGHARSNYSVSALAWLSDPYMAMFPAVMPALAANAAKRLSTENTFESLADMAHIDFVGKDASRSVFSTDFRERPRYVNAGERQLDWDAARFVGNCAEPERAN
jgi:glucan phosphoethanolaminetransferase (alkaline phosphatase superfamily)